MRRAQATAPDPCEQCTNNRARHHYCTDRIAKARTKNDEELKQLCKEPPCEPKNEFEVKFTTAPHRGVVGPRAP